MVSVGLVTLVSHFVGLPSTMYGLPLTINSRKCSLPILAALSSAGLPGHTSTTRGSAARAGSVTKPRTSVAMKAFMVRLR